MSANSNISIAQIDRRISVITGTDEQRGSIRRVSDLRPLPFVVLLGEPGIGKSTVLGVEAAHEQVRVIKVRELLTGDASLPGATLFLDALDEYRVEGEPSDKAHRLAKAMKATAAPRWRLSCRSEDWRKEADIASIRGTTGGAPIVVAQLQPLDHAEVVEILVMLGEREPGAFLANASNLGAGSFVESPLSLKLLQTAVAGGGSWPRTRFDLFHSAIFRLAYERNDEHKWRKDRHSPGEIIAAAAEMCLLMLVSGAKAIWTSNDEPPHSEDARAYLNAHVLKIASSLLLDTIDTPLFRGDGEAFEPMHRTLAEYLAAQALAHAVIGTGSRASLPLSRAIALITGNDGGPPTELRGLYAWFAAHLAKLGNEAGAMRLVAADSVTVLAYGDAAVFSTPTRREILANLDRDDPYFRASENGVTAVGGLAGEDLSADFTAVLTIPSDAIHRTLTVLEALTRGTAVPSMRPTLYHFALDPSRPEWQRRRAVHAWLNGAPDATEARRNLFDALASEPVSVDRIALRMHIAAMLPSEALSLADIKSIIAEFETTSENNVGMGLYEFRMKLTIEPRHELFDEPANTWRPSRRLRHRTQEVVSFLDHVLAAAIRQIPDLSGARLWRWTVNVRENRGSRCAGETANAIGAWLDRPEREVELFNAILGDRRLNDSPSAAIYDYTMTTNRQPSTAILRDILSRSACCKSKAESKRMLEVAVEIAIHPDAGIDAYSETYSCIYENPEYSGLLERLMAVPIEQWRWDEYRMAEEQRDEEAESRVKNLEILTPLLESLCIGRPPHPLEWAAKLYFGHDKEGVQSSGLSRLTRLTNTVVADAMVRGWEYLATVDFIDVDATKLGRADADECNYCVELAAVAGVDHLFHKGRLPDPATMPIVVAIAILKATSRTVHADRFRALERWAIDRLNLEPEAGAVQLLEFWHAAIESGATHPSGIWRLAEDDARGGAVGKAIERLLVTHRTMHPKTLYLVLRTAAKQIDRARLQAIAATALSDAAVMGLQRGLWLYLAFTLDPLEYGEVLLSEQTGEEAARLFDEELGRPFLEALVGVDGESRAHRESVIVRLLGARSLPDDLPMSISGNIVQRAIDALARDPRSEAGRTLEQLVVNPLLTGWQQLLRHSLAQQARRRRDFEFRHPAAEVVKAAVAGGPPVNASDLLAIAVEELRRLSAELHTGDTTSWKRYWNVDSQGKVTSPLIENECRDYLLDRLRDRMMPYRIFAAVPEARRGEETRADMLILTGAGRNLPLEAKRNFHREIWSAASTQLQGYAAAAGADRFGIYLVFWFGNHPTPTPARPDGAAGPRSASELESMLLAELSSELRARTAVVVFDVSNPEALAEGSPRKKRAASPTRRVPSQTHRKNPGKGHGAAEGRLEIGQTPDDGSSNSNEPVKPAAKIKPRTRRRSRP